MLFTTPKTLEKEKAIIDYRNNHPYAPFVVPTKKEISEAKKLLEAIKRRKIEKKLFS